MTQQLIKPADLRPLGEDTEQLAFVEEFLRTMRAKYDGILGDWLNPVEVRRVMRALEHCTLRIVLGKPNSKCWAPVPNGALDREKTEKIELSWKLWVEAEVKPPPTSRWEFLPSTAILEPAVELPKIGEGLVVAVATEPPPAAEAEEAPFRAFDRVRTTVRRVTGYSAEDAEKSGHEGWERRQDIGAQPRDRR